MATIVFNVTTTKLTKIKDAMIGLFPIPTSATYDVSGNETETVPIYTENTWAKKCIIKWVGQQVERYEERTKIDEAKASVVRDDNIMTL